jgi:hypothetical protein
MGVLKRRTRLVSFRIYDDEYQTLVKITAAQGARSISDFSRSALCEALKTNSNSVSLEPQPSSPTYIRDLIKSMQELGIVISRLSGQIEKGLRT